MRYLGNDTSIVRDADIDATNGLPSEAIYRTDTAAKVGGGSVGLDGPYTGAADTTIDVEVVDNGGSTIQVSQPSFVGVGSGDMSAVSAPGVAVQSVVVTLEDLGTETLAAYSTFQGITLRAIASGSGGNDIAIDVDHTALVSSDTEWSLQSDLSEGTNEYVGEQWDFGAAILEPAGTIPATAPRLRFGNDPQVYRQYKKYQSGRYVYSFTPKPVRDVHKGSKVHAITGTRTVTVTDGVTPETYTGIVTPYDALTAIRDGSSLIKVEGPIVNDRLPEGQGINELSVRTRSYVVGVDVAGNGAIERAELVIAVDNNTPTETLEITCTDASVPGSESWEVHGDVSGTLAIAVTAQEYAEGPYTFTIPQAQVPDPTVTGTILVEYIPAGQHNSETPMPSLCVEQPLLGKDARNGSWQYVYTKRPTEECDCDTGSLSGGPNFDCLGIDPTGGDVSSTDLLRYYMIRVDRWYSQLSRLLVRLEQSASGGSPSAHTEYLWQRRQQARVLNGLRQVITQAATRIFSAVDANAVAVWQATHVYAVGAIVQPPVRDGFLYRAKVGGTSNSSAPTFPANVGETVTDSGVTWECFSRDAIGAFEDAFEAVKNEATPNFAAPHKVWAAGTEFLLGTTPYTVLPGTPNGHYYQQVAGGTTDATEPSPWPTTGGTVTDGTVVWQDMGAYWTATTKVAAGEIIAPTPGAIYEASQSGTTGSSIPAFDAIVVTDGTVKWKRISVIDPVEQITSSASQDTESAQITDPTSYVATLAQYFAEAYAVAGVNANFDHASIQGDGCWQDKGDAYWWEFDGDEPYLPVQTGHYYHSAKMGQDSSGQPYSYSTREFGFGPRFGCPENLSEGDIIKVTISGVGGISSRGYQAGDAFLVRVNNATTLPFGGGQTGDDTLTWSVITSVDGRLPDYELITTAPAAYSETAGGGTLGFAITPGGIPFALGDQFAFEVEGGRFKWRRDGGSWSADLDIADTLLADGLTAVFQGGTAPSWVAGDRWSFKAEATFGGDQMRTPLPGEFAWTGSTQIDVVPSPDTAIKGVLIATHTIPSDAVITLLGSDDNFATTPINEVLPWHRDHIWAAVTADHAKYRITVDKGGSIRWLYLGESTQPTIRSGAVELGRLTKRRRIVGVTQQASLGATVEHTFLTDDAVDELFAMFDHAGEFNDRLFAIVPNDDRSEVGMVRIGEVIEVPEIFGFQPRDPAHWLQSMTLQLEAA